MSYTVLSGTDTVWTTDTAGCPASPGAVLQVKSMALLVPVSRGLLIGSTPNLERIRKVLINLEDGPDEGGDTSLKALQSTGLLAEPRHGAGDGAKEMCVLLVQWPLGRH